jgi:hypothetical protein
VVSPPPLLVLLAALNLSACSLVVDSKIRQCQANVDCARFGNSVCDPVQWVCIPQPARPTSLDAGASVAPDSAAADASGPAPDAIATSTCRGPNGCYACAPTTDIDFLNGCTDGRCVPFDNKKRLTNLTPEGTLRPLP